MMINVNKLKKALKLKEYSKISGIPVNELLSLEIDYIFALKNKIYVSE